MRSRDVDAEKTVSVCVSTFRRPALLRKTLESLLDQDASFGFDLVVVDNDSARTGEIPVRELEAAAEAAGIRLTYDVEPIQNIALSRNRAVKHAEGDFVAFIDDDERAQENWLSALVATLREIDVDGVFGPVLSEYPEGFPEWITTVELLPRARFATGTRLLGADGRTGNALLKRGLFDLREGPFDRDYGLTGGSDTDLLGFLDRQGATFGWCDEAIVYEIQDVRRADPRWYLTRAYRAGWARTKRSMDSRGSLIGAGDMLIKILPSLLVLIGRALRNVSNPRAMLLLIAMALAGQAGKIGYLLGLTIEEYRVAPSETD